MSTALTNEQIQLKAPSAFAGQPWEKQSDRYAFIPTSNVIDGLRNNGFAPVSAVQSLSRIPGKQFFTKHCIQFEALDSIAKQTVVGDSTVRMNLINSHDGTSRYVVSLGVFRKTCMNGAHVSEGLVQSISIRHTGNIVDEVLNATHQLIEQAPKITTTIAQWKQIILTDGEKQIIAEAASLVRFEGQAPVTIDQILGTRRREDNANDLWTVFNRVQENVVRGGLRYKAEVRNPETNAYEGTRNAKTRAVKSISEDRKLNQALWMIGERMAAEKLK